MIRGFLFTNVLQIDTNCINKLEKSIAQSKQSLSLCNKSKQEVTNTLKNNIMTKAYFTFTPAYSRSKMYGSVTLKDDNKVTVGIENARCYCGADRSRFRDFAKQIVEGGFKDPAIYSLVEEKKDTNLVDALTSETQDFKAKYLDQVKTWCETRYNRAIEETSKSEKQLLTERGIEFFEVDYGNNGNLTIVVPREASKTSKYRFFREAMAEHYEVINTGLEQLTEQRLKEAVEHYEQSIIKLASRLTRKGITTGNNLEVKSGWLSQNFNVTIKADGLFLRAFTIIASGPIQRPHYRFLIK